MQVPPRPEIETQRLHALGKSLMMNSERDPRFDRIVKLASRIFATPVAFVSLISDDSQWFKATVGLELTSTPRTVSFCGHAVAARQPLIVTDAGKDPRFFDNPLVLGPPFLRFYAGYPLFFDNQAIGTLCISADKPRSFDEEDLETLASLAAWAENEVRLHVLTHRHQELMSKLDQARQEALTDPLTGAWTRRIIDEQLARDLARHQAAGQESSVLLVDMDHFKAVNDQFGHDVGDAVLIELVQRMNHSLRPNDLVIRLGGDEFLVYLGACSAEDAEKLAERLLEAARSQAYVSPQGQSLPLGLTIGVGTANHLDMEQLMALADDALYDGKAAGRGCWASRRG
ncbi:sensor domain-containing diguanylate cyclase [Gallaecimonas kandeliae]|uniref:sensor domain-containing diguanylate cyclase n=1 Tax=Gallaecimonas kandeliae TaxID=3029055 RepID=UPI002649FB22|nr:sensor domain-containing diguanylate cyclase [Gallaecimonas kandeliae]WKE66409.1 sensor domain-containing diguanylate cyclase [Gallaecimonas kandeliae]